MCALKYAGIGGGPVAAPLAFGAAVTIAIYSTRDISGAHLNPAVSASLAVNKPDAFPARQFIPYCAAQMFGATAAAGLNFLMFKHGIEALEKSQGLVRGAKGSEQIFNGAFGMVANKKLMPKPMHVFWAEVGMTAALAFAIYALTDDKKTTPPGIVPPLVGTTVFTLAFLGGPVTGCGMNPARDLGPRLITGLAGWGSANYSYAWWAYTAGPFVGAIVGGLMYRAIMQKPDYSAYK